MPSGRVQCGREFGIGGKCESIRGPTHPQMRLLVLGSPMVHIGGDHKARRAGGSSGERTSFAGQAGNIARDPVLPLAGFGWCKPHDHAISACPERRHQKGFELRRLEFDFQLHGSVGIWIRRDFKGEFTRLVRRGPFACVLS